MNIKVSKCSQSDKNIGFHFFFSLPAAGLTNRPPVRDSDPGAPLVFFLIAFWRQLSKAAAAV